MNEYFLEFVDSGPFIICPVSHVSILKLVIDTYNPDNN